MKTKKIRQTSQFKSRVVILLPQLEMLDFPMLGSQKHKKGRIDGKYEELSSHLKPNNKAKKQEVRTEVKKQRRNYLQNTRCAQIINFT